MKEYTILLRESQDGDDVPYLAECKPGKGEVYKKEDVEPFIEFFRNEVEIDNTKNKISLDISLINKRFKLLEELREKL